MTSACTGWRQVASVPRQGPGRRLEATAPPVGGASANGSRGGQSTSPVRGTLALDLVSCSPGGHGGNVRHTIDDVSTGEHRVMREEPRGRLSGFENLSGFARRPARNRTTPSSGWTLAAGWRRAHLARMTSTLRCFARSRSRSNLFALAAFSRRRSAARVARVLGLRAVAVVMPASTAPTVPRVARWNSAVPGAATSTVTLLLRCCYAICDGVTLECYGGVALTACFQPESLVLHVARTVQ